MREGRVADLSVLKTSGSESEVAEGLGKRAESFIEGEVAEGLREGRVAEGFSEGEVAEGLREGRVAEGFMKVMVEFHTYNGLISRSYWINFIKYNIVSNGEQKI